jgi:uncharacterized protein YdaU (DUF1376 family)
MKDPAFLFYTKDFQSGTQDMSCEEIGAYLRLLMFQHQHGHIPADAEKQMRITGIFCIKKYSEVWQSISHKFMQKGTVLVNRRMQDETALRSLAKPKKLAAATLAGLISANKLNATQKATIKKAFLITDYEHLNEEDIKASVKQWFYKMLNQTVNNLADGNENENEDVNVIEVKNENKIMAKTTLAVANAGLVLPFASALFEQQWQAWKQYRASEHSYHYRSLQSEQAALAQLGELSAGSETTAIAIMHQSMAKGWKGFFELKDNNGTATPATGKGKVQYSNDFKRKIANRLQSG